MPEQQVQRGFPQRRRWSGAYLGLVSNRWFDRGDRFVFSAETDRYIRMRELDIDDDTVTRVF